MTVRVRMFAALREAAGTAEEHLPAAPLAELLAALCRRHGPVFAARMSVSTVLVDGNAVTKGTPMDVPDGAEVVLLPPVSGGR